VTSKRRGGISAVEVMAQKEQRLRTDPEYRRAVETEAAERTERTTQLRAAEQPVLDELASLGIELDTVWDLYKVPEVRQRAVPVLLKHLVLYYPDMVLMGIGQGLDDVSVRPWWAELKSLYLSATRDVVRDRLANALAVCATSAHYDELLAFVADTSLGDSRIYFLRPINRIGNRMSPGQGRSVVESVTGDPVLGREAIAILKGRSRNE
jgi:hypothetical protein